MDEYVFIQPLTLVPFDEEFFLRFVLRRHHASSLHWDFRIEANGILYSWFMRQPPMADPERPVWAGLAAPHNPRYMLSERYILPGRPGAGPTIVEDLGTAKPLVKGYSSQDLALHESFLKGRIPLQMGGRTLKGGYVMERKSRHWQFRKLDDGYAIATPLNWTGISPISGKTLQDFIPKKQRGDDDSGQLNFGY